MFVRRMKLKRILKWTVVVVFLGLVLFMFVAYWTSTNDCATLASVPQNPMKAIRYCEYGPPDVLKLVDVEKPVPKDNEVLIKVRAAGLNALDLGFGGQLLARFIFGLRKPKDTRFGTDYSGTIEAIGKNVTDFKVGDEVFGAARGAVAQYVCRSHDRAIAIKPPNVTFEQAGSVAIAGLTALQGLRDAGKIQAGQKVLVNGASGGIGTFAVQIAKSYGAEVTGVCSTRNVELVKSIGADHVIDYTKEDFTKGGERYDMIFDVISNHSFSERKNILTSNGICVLVGIGASGWHEDLYGRLIGNFTFPVRSRFTSQKFVRYITQLTKKDMTAFGQLMESGKVRTVIDRTYKLTDVPDAARYLDQGHARGKVVITIE